MKMQLPDIHPLIPITGVDDISLCSEMLEKPQQGQSLGLPLLDLNGMSKGQASRG